MNKDMPITALVCAVVIAIIVGLIASSNTHTQTTQSQNSMTPPVMATNSGTQTVSNASNIAPSVSQAVPHMPTSTVQNQAISTQYLANSNFMSSSSGVLTQTVMQASTNTIVSSNANPSVFGQEVTFTATVSPVFPATATPTGTVTFLIDGTPQTPVALTAGNAAISLSTLSHGTHTITAQYSGDANFKPSSGNTYPSQ